MWAAWRDEASNIGEGAHTGFPVVQSAERFTDQKNKGQLVGVPSAVCDLIESVQPYVVSPDNPAADALAILVRLSNIDKHRTIKAVYGAVARAGLGHSKNVVAIEQWDHGSFRALHGGRQEVASFVAKSDQPLEKTDLTEMYGYHLRIEEYEVGVLALFVRRVFEALWSIEHGSPPGPGAPFPYRQPGGRGYLLANT